VVRGLLALTSLRPAFGKVVVFWQDGYPAAESQPVSRAALEKALEGMAPEFLTFVDAPL